MNVQIDEKLKAWVKKTLDESVQDLMGSGVVDSFLVEAKPAWVFPMQILIGKIRVQGSAEPFHWFICGNGLPTDHVDSSLAATPRDAARHFSLKWQLDASRQSEPDTELAEKAEALYELVDEPSIWLQRGEQGNR